MAHLENWTLRNALRQMTTGSKHIHIDFLHGIVTGHPLIQDGSDVFTSPLLEFDPLAKTATTLSGTSYTLGQKSQEYEKWLGEHASGH